RLGPILHEEILPGGATYPCRVTATARDSRQWRRLTTVGRRAQEHIFWSLGSGEVSFWDEWWFGEAPFSSTRPVTHLPFMQVKDLWTGGFWDRDKMEDILGEGGGFSSLEIDQIRQISILEGGLDGMRWRLTSS
ncbi:Unknown protein, partial [Striga hermonthica]